MIYTLTLNPSMDYVAKLDRLAVGMTNRAACEEYRVGGKGINVSLILKELGIASTALGFTAGFVGEAIEKGLADAGIACDFVRLSEGNSRINLKIEADSETEINGRGPAIPARDFEKLLAKTDSIREGDTVVLSGSVPASLPEDAYARILKRLEWRNVRIVVDAAGELLMNCLRFRPFLVKPNKQELSELFGRELRCGSDIDECAMELRQRGARNVLVSLGGDGAVLYAGSGNVHRTGVVKGKVLNTVGCGDSMVAGFIAGYEKTGNIEYALRLGTACGCATALSPGLAVKSGIAETLCRLQSGES